MMPEFPAFPDATPYDRRPGNVAEVENVMAATGGNGAISSLSLAVT
jgi:hypothetical protein